MWVGLSHGGSMRSDKSVFQLFYSRCFMEMLTYMLNQTQKELSRQLSTCSKANNGIGLYQCAGKSNLHFCDGNNTAEQRFYSSICCLHDDIFSRDVHAFFNKAVQNNILCTSQSYGQRKSGYRYWTVLPVD